MPEPTVIVPVEARVVNTVLSEGTPAVLVGLTDTDENDHVIVLTSDEAVTLGVGLIQAPTKPFDNPTIVENPDQGRLPLETETPENPEVPHP